MLANLSTEWQAPCHCQDFSGTFSFLPSQSSSFYNLFRPFQIFSEDAHWFIKEYAEYEVKAISKAQMNYRSSLFIWSMQTEGLCKLGKCCTFELHLSLWPPFNRAITLENYFSDHLRCKSTIQERLSQGFGSHPCEIQRLRERASLSSRRGEEPNFDKY